MGISEFKTAETFERQDYTILLVDDDPVICELVRMCLDIPHYHFLEAHNSQDALELYRQHHQEIDLALLDVMLPNVTGVELFHQMKEINRAVRCLFVSGSLGTLDLDALRAEGVLGFVEKPFMYDVLVRKVANALMVVTIQGEIGREEG